MLESSVYSQPLSNWYLNQTLTVAKTYHSTYFPAQCSIDEVEEEDITRSQPFLIHCLSMSLHI